MTLCTAFIRQANDTEELVFATDSCLTGGEKWKHGIKLFELPRRDCLLCFAGSTSRAYPLILNMISSIHFDKYLESPDAKLEDALVFISDLFTELVSKIISEIPGEDIHELRSGAKFLFGGWDWEKGTFRVWKLYYSNGVEGFIFDELSKNSTKKRFYAFLGDPEQEIEKTATDKYKEMVFKEDLQDDPIDMEPLKILRTMSLDSQIREVDGSLQIAKVYKSNRTEFFGIYWESSQGKPYFQGREYNEMNKPLVRYYDLDTFEIIDFEIPARLNELEKMTFGNDFEFVESCYDSQRSHDHLEGNEGLIYHLKREIPEKDRIKLRMIFKEVTNKIYVQSEEAGINKKQES